MHIFRSFATGAVLWITAVGAAQAIIITETWESTVTSTTNTVFTIGDVFAWTVTYDDDSLIAHTYLDGSNDLAEQGLGDDTLYYTYCAGGNAYAPNCTVNHPDYSLMSDAIIDISSFYDAYANFYAWGPGHYLAGADSSWKNHSIRFTTGPSVGAVANAVSLVADDIEFDADDANLTGAAYTYFQRADGSHGKTYTAFTSAIIATTQTKQVPEPASLALMGLGLVGLGFARRQSKQLYMVSS